MKVKCIYNSGEALRLYEYESIPLKEMIGRFGATAYSEYNEIKVGKEYLVMGIIVFETYQGYLIDDDGFISCCPCQLFEVIDDKMHPNWHFRLIEKEENIYPFIQAILGYYELCFDKKAYEYLIVEKDKKYEAVYFKKKSEIERNTSPI